MKQILWAAIALFVFVATDANGQMIGSAKSDSSNFTFVPVPYINYDRTLGGTFGALPMGMYHLNRNDTVSPASLSGLGGIYTTNESYVFALFSKFYFGQNKYRATVAAAQGNINSQFFQDVPGYQGYVDFSNNTFYFLGQMQHKIINRMYGGINFTYIDRYTEFDTDLAEAEYETLMGVGAIITFDSRDSVYYPRSGVIGELKVNSYPKAFDNALESNTITADLNQYNGMMEGRDVLAFRGYVGVGLGDLSFNQQFVVNNTDIRGYTQGKYRGEQIVALQSEYRYNPFKKIGFVGFAGVASVFSGENEDDNAKLLPAGGVGFRVNVFPKNHMNIGIDVAAGVGDWGMYFRIGESF